MESPRAMLPSLPLIVTAPPLASPSPKVRVKLLFDDGPEAIDIFPQEDPSKSPVITLDASPMLVLEMSAVPASFHTATLFEHVANLTPNGIGMESSEAMLPSLPSVVTAPPLVSSSPKVRVELLVDGGLETVDTSPPAALDKLPAISLNASPMLVAEPNASPPVAPDKLPVVS
jgi:hypothetical protein